MIEVTPTKTHPEDVLYVLAAALLFAGSILIIIAAQRIQPTFLEKSAAVLRTSIESLGGEDDLGQRVMVAWMLFFGGLASCVGAVVSFCFGRVIAALRPR